MITKENYLSVAFPPPKDATVIREQWYRQLIEEVRKAGSRFTKTDEDGARSPCWFLNHERSEHIKAVFQFALGSKDVEYMINQASLRIQNTNANLEQQQSVWASLTRICWSSMLALASLLSERAKELLLEQEVRIQAAIDDLLVAEAVFNLLSCIEFDLSDSYDPH